MVLRISNDINSFLTLSQRFSILNKWKHVLKCTGCPFNIVICTIFSMAFLTSIFLCIFFYNFNTMQFSDKCLWQSVYIYKSGKQIQNYLYKIIGTKKEHLIKNLDWFSVINCQLLHTTQVCFIFVKCYTCLIFNQFIWLIKHTLCDYFHLHNSYRFGK